MMRTSFLVLITLMMFLPAYGLPGTETACPPALGSDPSTASVVSRYLLDSGIKRGWAIVVDCAHPNWPPKVREVRLTVAAAHPIPTNLFAGEAAPEASSLRTVIEYGSRVELWSDAPARIRLAGIALESGGVGQLIHVRAGLGVELLCGTIIAPHSVELAGSGEMCRRRH
jgi:hypothetical protein